jgi:hypothetical protein
MKKEQQLLGKDSLAKKMSQIKATMESEVVESKKKTTVKTTTEAQPKLFVNGKLDRKNKKYVLRSLALLGALNDDIQKYCRGGENAILNYLIKEGLKNVKKIDAMINVDISDIES